MRLSKCPGSARSVGSASSGRRRRRSSVLAADGRVSRYVRSVLRRAGGRKRKAALASPAPSAACITFVLPNAKSNWPEEKRFIRAIGSASAERPRASLLQFAPPRRRPRRARGSAPTTPPPRDRRLDLRRARSTPGPPCWRSTETAAHPVRSSRRRSRGQIGRRGGLGLESARKGLPLRTASATTAKLSFVQTPRPGQLPPQIRARPRRPATERNGSSRRAVLSRP